MDVYASILFAMALTNLGRSSVHDDVQRDAVGPARPARLVLRTVRHGAESIALPLREVRVEPDVYVIADGLETFAWPVEADTRPLIVEIAIPGGASASDLEFLPTLRSIDGAVGQRLLAIGRTDPGAGRISIPAESAALLWSDLIAEERRLRARAERLDCTKPGTRQALFRRLLLCTDFIHANYAEPLRVETLAEVSNLSPFHFTRLFGLVMDETPHAFLVRKRVAVARRLLAAGVARHEAATRAGFGCRSTLFRHLRTSTRRTT
jgi:AraC-like DNA-binding protein